MNKKIIYIAIFIALNCFVAFGQTPRKSPLPKPSPSPSPKPAETTTVISDGGRQELPRQTDFSSQLKIMPTIETILTEAEKQTQTYRETFKDLLASETKTFEHYDKNGDLQQQTVVESDFLVYQSPKAQSVAELRNVVRVDGKPIPDSQKRSERFFAELAKQTTFERELEKIEKEGSRYDKTLDISGLTLFEGGVLSAKLQPFFDFKLLGTENHDGNDVFVVAYRQTKKSPYVSINAKDSEASDASFDFKFDLPGQLKNADAFLNGKFWIDAKTYQIRREERTLTVQNASPIVVMETTFDYQPSDYEILVPKKITLVANAVRRDSKDEPYTAEKDAKVNFEYSKFRKTNVDVKILDDK